MVLNIKALIRKWCDVHERGNIDTNGYYDKSRVDGSCVLIHG